MKACCEIKANIRILDEGMAICKECGDKHKIFK